MGIFHGLTDGTGAYEVIRTFLYYYCFDRYWVKLNDEGIRLVGDDITMEEWQDPTTDGRQFPLPKSVEMSDALNLIKEGKLENDTVPTVYSIAVSESEFMKFNIDHDGSPGTMVSLFLSRAVPKIYPDSDKAIRITLCVNQRNSLHAPKAHQSLVGGVMLEYKETMRTWPLDRQATAYRGMVFAQTQEETVLAGIASPLQIFLLHNNLW